MYTAGEWHMEKHKSMEEAKKVRLQLTFDRVLKRGT